MSIKPQTCKYCILVCKQTQQAFLEYESITVDLNRMCDSGGEYLSVASLISCTGECRLACLIPCSKCNEEIA